MGPAPLDAALLDARDAGDDAAGSWRASCASARPQALLAIVTGMDVRGQNRANLALVDAVFRKPIDVGALDEFLAQLGGRPPRPPARSEGEKAGRTRGGH